MLAWPAEEPKAPASNTKHSLAGTFIVAFDSPETSVIATTATLAPRKRPVRVRRLVRKVLEFRIIFFCGFGAFYSVCFWGYAPNETQLRLYCK